MNRQEKIYKIYEKIANKELSFGCRIWDNIVTFKIWEENNEFWYSNVFVKMLKTGDEIITLSWFDEVDWKLIWHPVMIWDVLDWLYENNLWFVKEKNSCSCCDDWVDNEQKIIWLWKNLRLTLEKQPNECVDYIFNLIEWTK